MTHSEIAQFNWECIASFTHITSKRTIPSTSAQMKIQVTPLVKIFPTNIIWIWKNPNVTVLFLQTTQIHEWFLKNDNHMYDTHVDVSADICGSSTRSYLHYTNKNIQLDAHLHQLLTDLLQTYDQPQGRIKSFGAPRQWKHFCPLLKAVFLLGGGITPLTESNTTPPSPKTEITNILFYILNFASIIKFKM